MMGIFYKAKSKVLKFMSDIRVYPLGIVLYGQTGYKVKGDHTRAILDTIQTGDVLLTRYDHYLGYVLNLIGFWGHAGIYVGDNRVVHMLGNGIMNEDILTFCRKDHIMILRPFDQDKAVTASEKAINLWKAGVEYDYDFSEFNKTLYCSELVYEVYDKPKEIKYKKWVLPGDLISPFFKVVATFP
jgi:uncharacterized protein YycO